MLSIIQNYKIYYTKLRFYKININLKFAVSHIIFKEINIFKPTMVIQCFKMTYQLSKTYKRISTITCSCLPLSNNRSQHFKNIKIRLKFESSLSGYIPLEHISNIKGPKHGFGRATNEDAAT